MSGSQKHTTVPYSYRATLEISERIDGHLVNHRMELTGKLHPEPYEMATAMFVAQEFLQPFLDLGWRIDALWINGYWEKFDDC